MDHNDVRKRMYTFMCIWVTMLNIREKMKGKIKYSVILVIKYLVRGSSLAGAVVYSGSCSSWMGTSICHRSCPNKQTNKNILRQSLESEAQPWLCLIQGTI